MDMRARAACNARMRLYRPFTVCSAAACIALLAACITTSQRIAAVPKLENAPAVSQQTLHAGIYYGGEFVRREHRRALGSHSVIAQIGPTSARLFDDLLGRLFARTSRLSTLTAEEMRQVGVDVGVAVALEHFDFRIGFDDDSDRYSVAYRITLHSPSGVPVASWIVVGNGPPVGGIMAGIDGMIEGDLADAAYKFLSGFPRMADPALAAMARQRAGAARLDEAGRLSLTAKRSDLPGFKPEVVQLLAKAGVQAVEVTARSDTAKPLTVRASDMRLLLGSDFSAEPASPSSVLTLMESASPPGARTLVLGPLFDVLADSLEARARQDAQELRFREGGRGVFEDRTVAQGRPATGIVLFSASANAEYMRAARLAVWIVDPETATGARVVIPVTGLQ